MKNLWWKIQIKIRTLGKTWIRQLNLELYKYTVSEFWFQVSSILVYQQHGYLTRINQNERQYSRTNTDSDRSFLKLDQSFEMMSRLARCLMVGLPWGQFHGCSISPMWTRSFFISLALKAVPIITFKQRRDPASAKYCYLSVEQQKLIMSTLIIDTEITIHGAFTL